MDKTELRLYSRGIGFLKKASDYLVIENWNDSKNGKVQAFEVEWIVKREFIDRGRGDGYTQAYPQDIPKGVGKGIEYHSESYEDRCYQKFEEFITLDGIVCWSQSDNWGRKSLISISPFLEELKNTNIRDAASLEKKCRKIIGREAYYILREKVSKKLPSNLVEPFLKAKTMFKMEIIDSVENLVNAPIPKDIWKKLAEAKNKKEFEQIGDHWGIAWKSKSFPRRIEYVKLIISMQTRISKTNTSVNSGFTIKEVFDIKEALYTKNTLKL